MEDALFLMLTVLGPMSMVVCVACLFEGPTLGRNRPGYSGQCKKLKG